MSNLGNSASCIQGNLILPMKTALILPLVVGADPWPPASLGPQLDRARSQTAFGAGLKHRRLMIRPLLLPEALNGI